MDIELLPPKFAITNVVILLTSNGCRPSIHLMKRWDEITAELKTVDPKIKIISVHNVGLGFKFKLNPYIYPVDLKSYAQWTPMMISVPGELWNLALAHTYLGPRNPILLQEGVQILNGVQPPKLLRNITFDRRYNQTEIKRWFQDALQDQEFIRISTLYSLLYSKSLTEYLLLRLETRFCSRLKPCLRDKIN